MPSTSCDDPKVTWDISSSGNDRLVALGSLISSMSKQYSMKEPGGGASHLSGGFHGGNKSLNCFFSSPGGACQQELCKTKTALMSSI
jgi:hypothetical protein